MRTLLINVIISAVPFCHSLYAADGDPIHGIDAINLNRLTYTMVRAYHTKSIGEGFLETKAEDGTSYLVVDLKVRNPKPEKVEHDASFAIVDSEGAKYDLDKGATCVAKHGFFFGTFKIIPKFTKLVSLVFTVPKESLNQIWTLQIQNKDDESSPGELLTKK